MSEKPGSYGAGRGRGRGFATIWRAPSADGHEPQLPRPARKKPPTRGAVLLREEEFDRGIADRDRDDGWRDDLAPVTSPSTADSTEMAG